jgi:HEAT repeat protein
MADYVEHEGEHIWMEGVGAISVREPTAQESRQRQADAAVADALHTPEDLQSGMYHERADVRWRIVDRLIARGFDHPDTIPTFLDVLQHDPSPVVRGNVAFKLHRFSDDPRVVPALEHCARNDPDEQVRADARYSLGQED